MKSTPNVRWVREEGRWSTDWLKSDERERWVRRGGKERGWLKVERIYGARSPKVRWVREGGRGNSTGWLKWDVKVRWVSVGGKGPGEERMACFGFKIVGKTP